MRRYFKEF
jgi:hypothetical protein